MSTKVLFSNSNEIGQLIESTCGWKVTPLEKLDPLGVEEFFFFFLMCQVYYIHFFYFINTDAYATYDTYNVVHTLLTMLYTVCHLRY